MRTIARLVLAGQGSFYIVTGVWPLVHYPSFEAVTGPKTDVWLVHTVGLLLAVIGATLVAAARHRTPPTFAIGLAIGAAVALAAIEVFYVLAGVIGPIYLADAAVEAAFAIVLLAALRALRRPPEMRTQPGR